MNKLMVVTGAALIALTGVLAQDFDPMQMADTSGDGKVSPAEFAAFREAGWGYFSNGAEQVKVADLPDMAKGAFKAITPDANGMVSHKAYTDAGPAIFKAADKNNDGFLDATEIKTTI